MNSFVLTSTNERKLGKRLNFSIWALLSIFSFLFIYLYSSYNHIYSLENKSIVESLVGVILLITNGIHYINFIKSLKSTRPTLLVKIFRHFLNLGIMLWVALAVFSSGHIDIGEISVALHFVYLTELCFTLHQKSMMFDQNIKRRNTNIRSAFFATFVLMGIILWYFYFIFDFVLSPLLFFINWFVYGLMASLIVLNANLIHFLIFGKHHISNN